MVLLKIKKINFKVFILNLWPWSHLVSGGSRFFSELNTKCEVFKAFFGWLPLPVILPADLNSPGIWPELRQQSVDLNVAASQPVDPLSHDSMTVDEFDALKNYVYLLLVIDGLDLALLIMSKATKYAAFRAHLQL